MDSGGVAALGDQREVKSQSSSWVRDELHITGFAGQEVYSTCTLSPNAVAAVRSDIDHQEDHHRQRGLREELIDLLTKAELEFDVDFSD